MKTSRTRKTRQSRKEETRFPLLNKDESKNKKGKEMMERRGG